MSQKLKLASLTTDNVNVYRDRADVKKMRLKIWNFPYREGSNESVDRKHANLLFLVNEESS